MLYVGFLLASVGAAMVLLLPAARLNDSNSGHCE